jgi:hypothetical protein
MASIRECTGQGVNDAFSSAIFLGRDGKPGSNNESDSHEIFFAYDPGDKGWLLNLL